MHSIQLNGKHAQHDNKDLAIKMRDSSTNSEGTLSTVSSAMSVYDIEETDGLTTDASYLTKVDDRITYSTTVTVDKTADDDVNSIVSHVSSLSGQVISMKAENNDTVTDKVRIPQHITGNMCNENYVDDDDDDLSFAPLDDDDDNLSFAPLEDDDDDENNNSGLYCKTDQRECPSDEEDDESNIHRQQGPTRKKAATKSLTKQSDCEGGLPNLPSPPPSMDDMNCYNEKQFIRQKTLPGLDGSYKIVCVSFMEYNIATSVACRVLDESYRMLRPGGLLYVIDKGGCTVHKHPTMRQWLSRVRDPTVKHFIYEIETRAILQSNGFVHTSIDENNTKVVDDDSSWEDDEIVRWIGIKV